MANLNVSGIDNDNDNATLVSRRSDTNCSEPDSWSSVGTLHVAAFYVTLTVGTPGNILSAIVWLRHSVAIKSSSAIYLAALAVNDLVYLLSTFLYIGDIVNDVQLGWLCSRYVAMSAATLEPLLVLGFSVERLVAIVRPLQVCGSAAFVGRLKLFNNVQC